MQSNPYSHGLNMSIRESKIIELEKKVDRLQSYIALLEKIVHVDDNVITLTVGESHLSISENEVFVRSGGTLKTLSKEYTQIKSEGTMDIQSQNEMNISGTLIHIN